MQENARIKQVAYLQNGDTDINVYVDIIDKRILFDEDITNLSFYTLKDILKNAKKEIKKRWVVNYE